MQTPSAEKTPINQHLPPHLREVCTILAAGLVRLRSRTAAEDAQAGRQVGEGRDILLHSTAWQRLHANPNRKGLA
jgi:hypothetical protein